MAKVFIAEDDPQVLQALVAMVKGAGHAVMSFTDGRAAFEAFEREKPHAVIADVLIPNIAGSGLSHRVKKAAPHVGVVLISGVYTDPAFAAEATNKYKADAFLLKPFTAQQLIGALDPLVKKAMEVQPDSPATSPAAAPAATTAPPAARTTPTAGVAARASAASEPILGAGDDSKNKSIADRAEEAAKAAAAVRAAMAAAGIGKGARPAASDPAPARAPAASASAPAAPAAASSAAAPAAAPEEYAGTSFPPEGSLEKLSVIGLLYRCSLDKLTGRFSFRKDVAAKDVWVKDGKIAWTVSNLESDKLEFRLKQEGKLTEEQYKDVGVLAKGLGGAEGALIQLKVVDPAQMFDLAKQTATALVLEIFKWLGGKYQFTANAAPPAGSFPLDLAADDLIARGLKESFDLARLHKALGPRLKAPAGKDLVGIQHVDKLKLTPAEFRLSRMIDGKKSVEAIAKEWAGGDAAKELRGMQVLFLMAEAGMIRLSDYVAPAGTGTGGPAAPKVNLDELRKKLSELEKQNHFEVLGVSKTATGVDTKKAYFALAKKYHPDTLPVDASPEHRRLIEQIFAIISRANTVLEDPKQREEYLRDLNVGGTGQSLDPEMVLQAELEFQKGEFFLLKKKDLVQAEKHLSTAMKMNPTEAEHHVLWGWLLWMKSKGVAAAEAEKYILAGLKMRQNIPNAYIFLGHIYKAKGDIPKAEKFYRKCLEYEENNNEAMSELRVIAMRKGKK